ncbi:hypothetical protein OMR07_14150 [Methylobacterium organophilum]|nr:hypothetical protein [Methylobacterium organophilum]
MIADETSIEAAGLHEIRHLGRRVEDAAAQRGRPGRNRYGTGAVLLAGRPLGEGTTTARIEPAEGVILRRAG